MNGPAVLPTLRTRHRRETSMPPYSTPRFYVYVLAYPDGKPFYVGKGTKDRIFAHEVEARTGHRCRKCRVIRKVWSQGGQIQRYYVFTTDDEHEALQYEFEIIAMFGRSTLVNLRSGGEYPTGHPHTIQTRRQIGDSIKSLWARRKKEWTQGGGKPEWLRQFMHRPHTTERIPAPDAKAFADARAFFQQRKKY